MAKGQVAKLEVAAKIIEAFGDNAFLYNDGKEVRVNTVENGEPVQIKLTLTCAKTAVTSGDEDALPTNAFDTVAATQPSGGSVSKADVPVTQVSATEQKDVANLLSELGIAITM